MRIAIASETDEKGKIAEHFGRCAGFAFFDIEGKKVVREEFAKNPVFGNHVPGAVPQFLISKKANVMIAGGAGPQAVTLLESAGIEVIFINGKVQDAAKLYLEGKLGKNENTCSH